MPGTQGAEDMGLNEVRERKPPVVWHSLPNDRLEILPWVVKPKEPGANCRSRDREVACRLRHRIGRAVPRSKLIAAISAWASHSDLAPKPTAVSTRCGSIVAAVTGVQ